MQGAARCMGRAMQSSMPAGAPCCVAWMPSWPRSRPLFLFPPPAAPLPFSSALFLPPPPPSVCTPLSAASQQPPHRPVPPQPLNRKPHQAWVLAALEDEARAPSYYGFAALYALPLLRTGFEIDGFSIAMLLTGIAQVQVRGGRHRERETTSLFGTQSTATRKTQRSHALSTHHRHPSDQATRIAATEPELQASIAKALTPLGFVKTVARALRSLGNTFIPQRISSGASSGGGGVGAAAAARGSGRRRGGQQLPAGDGRQEWGARVGEGEGEGPVQRSREEEIEGFLRDEEFRDFDRRLRAREGRRR
jgi:hypothetical protein